MINVLCVRSLLIGVGDTKYMEKTKNDSSEVKNSLNTCNAVRCVFVCFVGAKPAVQSMKAAKTV